MPLNSKRKNIIVSFDVNFRSQLWSWEEARALCTYVDVLIGIEPYHLWKNEKDHYAGDIKDGIHLQPSYMNSRTRFSAPLLKNTQTLSA